MLENDELPGFRRRVRYRGTHPRQFREKYKELDPDRDPETIARVIASGKTPAGQHRPILVSEILEQWALQQPCCRVADVTLGYGGHAERLLSCLKDGRLLGLDVDAVQLPKTEARLRGLGFGEDRLIVRRSNYAGLAKCLSEIEWDDGVDFILADLGLSSMQIDNPERGFSYKHDGPLDMRMNPERGVSASAWLAQCRVDKLAKALAEGGDEPEAERLAEAIVAAGDQSSPLKTTGQLRRILEAAIPNSLDEEERKSSVMRAFQAIRIAVNEEFSALDAFLARVPGCLRAGGRVVILSFHSGEDRRVKHHFRDGFRNGIYAEIAQEVIRPSYEEVRGNSRAASAKMRWAVKAAF